MTSPKCVAEKDAAPHLWHWGEDPGRGVRPGFRQLAGDPTMPRPVEPRRVTTTSCIVNKGLH